MIQTQENKSGLKKEIEIWFKKMDLPEDMYYILKPYHKDILHRSICKPFKPVSTVQRRELYNAFCSTMEFRSSDYQSGDEATDDYLKDFFAPNSAHDRIPKDEWGG